MFAQAERKDREILTLKGLLRKLCSLLEAHREAFGEISTINYD